MEQAKNSVTSISGGDDEFDRRCSYSDTSSAKKFVSAVCESSAVASVLPEDMTIIGLSKLTDDEIKTFSDMSNDVRAHLPFCIELAKQQLSHVCLILFALLFQSFTDFTLLE